MNKRKWRYVMEPGHFGIPGCRCGSTDCTWSEYEGYLWCHVCSTEFVPTDWGVFDGPIPVEASGLMGMSFERVEIEE
jgi:hypothetical protein